MGSGQAGAGGKRGTRGRWRDGAAGGPVGLHLLGSERPLLLAQTPHTCANSTNSSARSGNGQKEASRTPVNVPVETVSQLDRESVSDVRGH